MSDQEQVQTAKRVECHVHPFGGGYVLLGLCRECMRWVFVDYSFDSVAKVEEYARGCSYSDYRHFRLPADDEPKLVAMPEELMKALPRILEVVSCRPTLGHAGLVPCKCLECIVRRAMAKLGIEEEE